MCWHRKNEKEAEKLEEEYRRQEEEAAREEAEEREVSSCVVNLCDLNIDLHSVFAARWPRSEQNVRAPERRRTCVRMRQALASEMSLSNNHVSDLYESINILFSEAQTSWTQS